MKKKSPLIAALQKLFNRRLFIFGLILLQIAITVILLFRSLHLRWLQDLLTIFSVITALHLLLRQDKAAFKLSLIFLILLFPVFGGVFYWIFHGQTASGGFHGRITKIERESAPLFGKDNAIYQTAYESLPSAEKQLRYFYRNTPFPIYDNTETEYFPSGADMHRRLLEDLKTAERYIFMEYFIIAEGEMWDSILEILTERAAAGVDVRVIYDDVGSMPTLPPAYTKKLRARGIACKKFNPFHPFLTGTQNNRDHRKITSIDGRIAYTGGVNLADEYIGKKIRFGQWKDSAIRLSGNGAWGLTLIFLQMWSFLARQKEDFSAYRPEHPSTPEGANAAGWVQPYCDSPMDRETVGEQLFLRMIEQAQHYLYITTPYLMVDDHMIAALKASAKCGVDVRLITPEIPDKPAVHFTSRSYYRTLIESGVRIYEYTGGFMHAKNIVSDDTVAGVGTVNFDFRSLYLHFECGVCLYKTDTIEDIKRDYLDTLAQCREITEKDCRHNVFVSLFQSILRIFAPLM